MHEYDPFYVNRLPSNGSLEYVSTQSEVWWIVIEAMGLAFFLLFSSRKWNEYSVAIALYFLIIEGIFCLEMNERKRKSG